LSYRRNQISVPYYIPISFFNQEFCRIFCFSGKNAIVGYCGVFWGIFKNSWHQNDTKIQKKIRLISPDFFHFL